jgi:hypothetical protein
MRPRDGSVRPIYHTQNARQSVTSLCAGPLRLTTTDRIIGLAVVAAGAWLVHAAAQRR